jgi:hypothetical protein
MKVVLRSLFHALQLLLSARALKQYTFLKVSGFSANFFSNEGWITWKSQEKGFRHHTRNCQTGKMLNK